MANPKSLMAAALAAFALVSAVPASAQTNRIGGVVRDETGEIIRGAIVRATTGGTAAATPLTLTTATDDRGRFFFVVSRSGEWQLTIEAPGFDPMTIAASVRLTGAAPNLDVKLDRHESPEAFGALAGVDSRILQTQLSTAAALLDDGRYDQAITAYREIKAKAPALTLVNLPLGNAYLGKKSYSDAEAMFQEILKSDQTSADGLFAMGTVREAQGNVTEAQTWYQRASSADAVWTKPLMKLASLARAAGDRAGALRYLTRVIDIDASSVDAAEAQSIQKQLQ
jgi:Flp pilus assembly protein TadD